MPMDYHVWGAMLEHYQRYMQKLTSIAELKDFFCQYGMISCRSLLILRQSYHFTTEFDHVVLQLVDILNTLFKY